MGIIPLNICLKIKGVRFRANLSLFLQEERFAKIADYGS